MEEKQKTGEANMDRLRKRAETLQQKLNGKPLEKLSAEEAQRLVQEMHLYQIELELQNEQLMAVTEELALTSRKFEDLYDFAPVGYITLDQYGLILEVNLACLRLFKVDRYALVKRRFAHFIVPEQLERFYNFIRKVLESDVKQTGEFTFSTPDHSVFEARLECFALEGKFTEGRQIRVALIDITETKAVQQQLEESRNFVQKIADTIPDILTVYDLVAQKNIYGNREIETLLGLNLHQIQTSPREDLMELVHPDDREHFNRQMQATRLLQDGEVSEFEYRIRNSEGRYLWLRVRSVVFQRQANGAVSQLLSVQQDITFRKETEEALRFKDQIITGLQSNLPVVVSIIAPDGTFRAMTGSALKSLEKEGLPNLEGQNIFELFPDLRPRIESVFQTGETVSYMYCLGKNKETCFQNYVYLDLKQDAAISFSIDISEQIASEQKIIAEREFSQSLLDNSVDGILAFDLDLRFTAWNKVMENHTSLSKQAVLGKDMFRIFPPFKDTDVSKAVKRVLKGKRMVLYNQNLALPNTNLEVYLNPLFDAEGKVCGGLCILHDVTEQRRLEAESTQLKLNQQKVILNAVLDTQEVERKRIAESLHNGVGQLLYAAKLSLESSKAKNGENQKVLHDLLEEAINETRTISFELMPSILEDFGLETALQELRKRVCVGNLHLNLETENMDQRFQPQIEIAIYRIIQELVNNIIKHSLATVATVHLTYNRNTIRIIAEDNGIGFDQDDLENRRKGLGLTSIRSRVKLLDGRMNINSRPGKGTIVTVAVKV